MARKSAVIVGAKNCTEGNILSELLALLIEDRTNLKVMRKFNLDSYICFSALLSNDIDLYVEYTGTALGQILKQQASKDPRGDFDYVKTEFQKRFKLEWLDPFGFENAYALLVCKDFSLAHQIESITEFVEYLSQNPALKVGFDQEFYSRPEFTILSNKYFFKPKISPILIDHALLYLTLANKNIHVMNGYATDGFIVKYDFICLKDDRNLFPSYLAAPLVSQAILLKHPNLRQIFNILSDKISSKQMQQLNFEVEVLGKTVHQTAYDFLKKSNLICH